MAGTHALHRHGRQVHAHSYAGPHRHLRYPLRSRDAVILRITWQSWQTVRAYDDHHH